MFFRKSENEKLIGIWHKDYYNIICYQAFRMLDHKEDAEDIAASVFAGLFNYEGDLKEIKSVTGFLITRMRNVCIDHFRKKKREQQRVVELRLMYEPEAEEVNEYVIRSEVLSQLYREIEELPKKCREIFKLTVLQNVPVSEVAKRYAISEQTVRNQKARAIHLLKLAAAQKDISFFILLCCLLQNNMRTFLN